MVDALVQLESHHKHHHSHRHHHKNREDPAPEPTNNTTEEDDAETITPLPDCLADGSNGVKGVDCKKPKAKKMCKNNQEPTVLPNEERPNCVVLPTCDANPGMAVGECYAPGSLAQIRHKDGDGSVEPT